jgi:hypothetical protein
METYCDDGLEALIGCCSFFEDGLTFTVCVCCDVVPHDDGWIICFHHSNLKLTPQMAIYD